MEKGIFAVYKPLGITSYDVIRRLKRHFPGEKIGHGGTLDPLAEGVLVLGVGREATRKLQDVLKGTDKEYEVLIKLGQVSETDDAEGPIIDYPRSGLHKAPDRARVEEALEAFIGLIEQVPPKYSAVKLQGKSAYARMRKGETIELAPKKVDIKQIEMLSYNYPDLSLRVVTGSGVYIRSLARDLGEALQVGGYVSKLKRTRVGDFHADKALRLDDVAQAE